MYSMCFTVGTDTFNLDNADTRHQYYTQFIFKIDL